LQFLSVDEWNLKTKLWVVKQEKMDWLSVNRIKNFLEWRIHKKATKSGFFKIEG
jgi:hypothetical protein